METVSGFLTIPASGSVTVQPPVGEAWALKTIAHSLATGQAYLFDGTNLAGLYSQAGGDTGADLAVSSISSTQLPLMITDTVYLRTYADTSSRYFAYTGVKL